jgi:cation transport ATPase
LTKCEYCGEEIGLLAVRYTWLDKENNRAMHDKCYEKYKMEKPEKIQEPVKETQIQKEETKPAEKMVLTKILGIFILFITIPAVIWSFYVLFRFENAFSYTFIFSILLYLLCIFLGIELIRVKKKGGYYIFLLVVGLVVSILLLVMIVISILASMYVYFAIN